MAGAVAYSASDPKQQAFLASLAQGETGGYANASTVGVGGSDLSAAPTDVFGFPLWSGTGSSHAAGTYQFQPGTWDPIAAQYGLNFQNSADQSAGAWYLAQSTYAQKTNGGSLEDALSAGHYTDVQSALAGVWPSVGGNGAAPAGLAGDLADALGSATGSTSSGASAGSTAGASTSVLGTVEGFFERSGLIIIGGVVVLIALYWILSNTGAVPKPAQIAKALPALVA